MVLIWPDNLPLLSLTQDNNSVVGDKSSASESDPSVLVGFVDGKFSTVIICAIKSDSKLHNDLNKEVTSAIEQLAECHLRCSQQSEGGWQECSECTTYKSLRVVAEFNENNGTGKELGKHKEVIIYNPADANTWNTQYNEFRKFNNKATSQMNWRMRMMSKSGVVFRELSSVLSDNTKTKQQQRMGFIPKPTESAVKIPSDYTAEPKCNPTSEDNSDWFGEQSLFSLHWSSSLVNPNTISLFEEQIPLFRALRSMREEGRCSISSTAITLDFVLGLLIGAYLIQYPKLLIQQIAQAISYHDQFFTHNLQWLETFPVGFKLNVALTHRIGKEVRWIIFYHESLYSSMSAATAILLGDTILFEQIATSLLQSMGILTALFGSRFFFAIAFDLTRVALMHIHVLSEMFAACLRFEMSALKSFWLLFTGKKRNVLRQRSDHLHYDHMQLLLGMILFSTCLFLFTTVLVYHWFFAVTNIGAELFCGILWFLHVSLEGCVQCERIILRRRRNRSNDTWKGNEVQFTPVSLHESISNVDDSYLAHLYDEGSERKEVRSNLLPSHVSTENQESCVWKVAFRLESDFSIVFAALASSISSVLSHLPTLLKRLLFGSQCNLAHAFIGFTNSLIRGK